ncbi:MAG: TOBE domain-containing protein, partial [Thermoanaerobaculia bacterium]
EPSILLLDEPLSNLEAGLRNQMRRELRRIQGETGQTIIYVTHDQVEALSLAHRIAVMNLGALQQYNVARKVYHFPANRFVGRFLGNPPMNFVEGTVTRADGRLVFVGDQDVLPLPANGSTRHLSEETQVVVGIRAEAMAMVEAGHPDGFTCVVLAVEPQGPETVVTARFAAVDLKVVVPTQRRPREGDRITLVPRGDLLALFDADSGVRLEAGDGAS